MTFIKDQSVYNLKSPVSLDDYVIGSNSQVANKKTQNFKMLDIFTLFQQGLSPEDGGVLKITELEYSGVLTTPSEIINAMVPAYAVARYELFFLNYNDKIALLKLQNVTIGNGEDAVVDADFIEFPTSVGPTGATGNGIASIALLSTVGLVKTYRITYTNASFFDFAVTDGTNGTNYTANNLQRTFTASTEIPTDTFTILETDNNSTIIINNGDTAVDITVPTGLSSKFAVGFIQQGTADVTFVESGTTINSPLDYLKIKGENYWAYLEKVGTSEVFQLAGEIKE
jgi:hypothetical protein